MSAYLENMSNGIPSDAVGASVGVLVYSIICWFLCTILVGLLITFGEKLSCMSDEDHKVFKGITNIVMNRCNITLLLHIAEHSCIHHTANLLRRGMASNQRSAI